MNPQRSRRRSVMSLSQVAAGSLGTPSGKKANFGIKAGVENGTAYGQVNYVDHGARFHVKSSTAVYFLQTDTNTRMVEFIIPSQDADTRARVFVTDNGEPGRDDRLEVQLLSNGSIVYHAAGSLGGDNSGGGNIQLHKANCR